MLSERSTGPLRVGATNGTASSATSGRSLEGQSQNALAAADTRVQTAARRTVEAERSAAIDNHHHFSDFIAFLAAAFTSLLLPFLASFFSFGTADLWPMATVASMAASWISAFLDL